MKLLAFVSLLLITSCGYQVGTVTDAVNRANEKIQAYKRLYCEAATDQDRQEMKSLLENLGAVVTDDYCKQ